MGDWCGPKSDTDRLKTGARDLRRSNADELIQREKKKILFPRNVRAYLTWRLMGDPTTLDPTTPSKLTTHHRLQTAYIEAAISQSPQQWRRNKSESEIGSRGSFL